MILCIKHVTLIAGHPFPHPNMSRLIPREPIVGRRPPPGPSIPARKPGQPLNGGRVGTNAKGTEDGYLYVAGVKDPSKRVAEFRVRPLAFLLFCLRHH